MPSAPKVTTDLLRTATDCRGRPAWRITRKIADIVYGIITLTTPEICLGEGSRLVVGVNAWFQQLRDAEWFVEHNNQDFMNHDVDLDDALSFVVERIEGEATRSGKPLTEEEGLLLNHLPTAPLFPLTASSTPEFPPRSVPRDLAYERLIALAKEALQHDVRVDSMSDRRWRYAATVCKLNKHPMSWLLQWSGIREQKPWWDRSLLLISATLLAFCFVAIIFLGIVETWTRLSWIAGGLGYFVVVLLLFFGSRHIEKWQLRREVEKYRLASQD